MMPGRRPLAWAVGLTLGLTAVRLLLAANCGLGDDEAYYWQWSRAPAWGYLDHPPAVAALIRASTGALGETALAVRLPFVALGWVTSAAVAALAAGLAPRPARGLAAALALLLTQLPPLFGLSTVFAAPDGPLLACTAGAALLAWRALCRDQPRAWLAVGALVGGALLSKHVAGLLPVGLFGLMLSDPVGRRHLRGPWPWAGVALAAALWAPHVAWSVAEGHPSLAFHLTGRPGDGGGPTLAGPAVLLLGQLVYLGPAVAPLVVGAFGRGRGRRLAVALGGPAAVLFLVASPWIRPLPHWWAPLWVVAAAPAAVWLTRRPRWSLVTLGGSGALTLALYLQAGTGLLPLPRGADPTVDLVTWQAVGPTLVAAVEDAGGAPIVASSRYQVTAQAAWALRHTSATPARVGGARADQYSRWGWDRLPDGARVIWLDHDALPGPPPPALAPDCGPPTTTPVRRAGRAVREVRWWVCRAGPPAQPK